MLLSWTPFLLVYSCASCRGLRARTRVIGREAPGATPLPAPLAAAGPPIVRHWQRPIVGTMPSVVRSDNLAQPARRHRDCAAHRIVQPVCPHVLKIKDGNLRAAWTAPPVARASAIAASVRPASPRRGSLKQRCMLRDPTVTMPLTPAIADWQVEVRAMCSRRGSTKRVSRSYAAVCVMLPFGRLWRTFGGTVPTAAASS